MKAENYFQLATGYRRTGNVDDDFAALLLALDLFVIFRLRQLTPWKSKRTI